MSTPEVMKVKPWGEGQGDHVLINASDFDPSFHVPFDAPESDGNPSDGLKVDELKDALTAKGIDFPVTAKKADLQALLDAAG